LTQIPVLLGLIGLAMLVYFTTAFAIGGADLGMLRRSLKRGARAPTDPKDANDSTLD
jgi:putative peptidoglycan lipid II flippase